MTAMCSQIEKDCQGPGIALHGVLPLTGRLQAVFDDTQAYFTRYLRELPVIWPGSTPH